MDGPRGLEGYLERTTPVGSYPGNPWGLHDMHGNVEELCADWYAWDAYAACKAGVRDPMGPSVGSSRVKRGGSWLVSWVYARSADRHYNTPSGGGNDLGFRVARTP